MAEFYRGPWPQHGNRDGYSIVDLTGHSKFGGIWRIEGTGFSFVQLVAKVKAGVATREREQT